MMGVCAASVQLLKRNKVMQKQPPTAPAQVLSAVGRQALPTAPASQQLHSSLRTAARLFAEANVLLLQCLQLRLHETSS